MSFPFFPHHGFVYVRAELDGPATTVVVRLALDTGATHTIINTRNLVAAGCDPTKSGKQVQFATASGPAQAKVVYLQRVEALGITRKPFPVFAPMVPVSSTADGVLGLDFLRGTKLEIDFRNGAIDLS